MSGPLDSCRVLELGSFIAGPFAGQLLGDLGAEVIKIEPSGGDPMRQWGICIDGRSLWWPAIARNKQSIVVDLRHPEGQEVARRLARECDAVLENFQPGQLDRWGLDYPTLAAANRRIVVVHVSGFGQTGPRATEPGFGSVGEAMGGLRHLIGEPDRPPARAGVSLGDALAALFAVNGLLAALHERERSGRGQEVDVAIYEAVLALTESTLADWQHAGVVRGRTGGVLPGVAPSNAYPTADGGEVVIAGNADAVFARLAKAMDMPELATDERYATHRARGRHQAELDEIVARWTRTKTKQELLDLLRAHDVPVGVINTAPDILADEHIAARGMVVHADAGFGEPTPMPGVIPRFSRTPGAVRRTGPALGADTDTVLQAVGGYTADEIARLRAMGVVQ